MSHSVQEKVIKFGTLQDGWYHGKGIKIEGSLIIYAIDLIHALINEGYENLDALPGLGGEIIICAFCSNHRYYLTIDNIDNITYEHDIDEKRLEFADRLTFDEVINKIKIGGFSL